MLLEHLQQSRLFPESGTALLAVSGGPDSVALLDLMHKVAPALDLRPALAHVDHGIAPDSADIAEQVMGLAVRFKVPGYLATLKLGPEASETKARTARYRALREIQRRIDARYLVTAHQKDDQIETVLFRLLKGSGTAGLSGIAEKGRGGLVRPLLRFRHDELRSWLAWNYPDVGSEVPIHTDAANFDLRHDRSWIRHKVLPVLRERFADQLDRRLLDVAEHALGERRAWSALLEILPELEFRAKSGAVEVARASLRTYDKTLSEALLRALAREVGCRLGPKQARQVLEFAERAQSGRALEVGNGWVAEIAFDKVRIVRPAKRTTSPPSASWGTGSEGESFFGDWRISWTSELAGEVRRNEFTTWVTPGSGEIRAVQVGDRTVPLGGVGSRKVRRILAEARITQSERNSYPLLVRGDDVIWVPGICRSAVAVPPQGQRALRIDASRVGDT